MILALCRPGTKSCNWHSIPFKESFLPFLRTSGDERPRPLAQLMTLAPASHQFQFFRQHYSDFRYQE